MTPREKVIALLNYSYSPCSKEWDGILPRKGKQAKLMSTRKMYL